MKSYGVTIQVKVIEQNFHVVPFTFTFLTKSNSGFVEF